MGGEWLEGIPTVITDHTNVCQEAAIRSEGCVYVLGWEHQVPDCRAVREQRLSMKQDHTITTVTQTSTVSKLYFNDQPGQTMVFHV